MQNAFGEGDKATRVVMVSLSNHDNPPFDRLRVTFKVFSCRLATPKGLLQRSHIMSPKIIIGLILGAAVGAGLGFLGRKSGGG